MTMVVGGKKKKAPPIARRGLFVSAVADR